MTAMDAEAERRIEELFQIAVHLREDERDAFYQRHLAGEPELVRELESLIAHDDDETKSFLKSPVLSHRTAETTGAATPAAEASGPESIPERIGPYLVIRKIGEGGMGAVYLAEQRSPIKRQVAIKVIKLGMDTADVLSRFEVERQALSLMDHPGIARILDGGATDQGRPYFVMEYAPGLPIHRYCDKHDLDLDARLALFSQVCDAVQHAHQKGVVHRDLKPSNVLVTERDGEPAPKIIDFGIACATDDSGRRWTRETAKNEIIGTFHYMSPEQASPDETDVDTRSDVYSLGVLLYELLTGTLPIESKALTNKTPIEIQRVLLESTPPPPSRRLLATRTTRAEKASARSLVRRLSGDLDWITIKALERDRTRRYATASELSADIQRHLAHELVLAGPPELSYRLMKFARRNRAAVLASGAVFLALVVGTIGLLWGFIKAEQRSAEALVARERAEVEKALAVSVKNFLVKTIAAADSTRVRDPNVTLDQVLRHAGTTIDATFAGYPEGEIDVRIALAGALASIDDLAEAEKHFERALDLQSNLLSATVHDVYETTRALWRVYDASDSQESVRLRFDAEELALRAVEQLHPEVGARLVELDANLLDLTTEERTEQLAAVLELATATIEPDDRAWRILADCVESQGFWLAVSWRQEESIAFFDAALDVRRRSSADSEMDVADTARHFAGTLAEIGEYEEARDVIRSALDVYERTLPAGHWITAVARSLLGEALSGLGDLERGGELLSTSHAAILAARGRRTQAGIDSTFRLIEHCSRIGAHYEADAHRADLADAIAWARNPTWRWDQVRAAFPAHLEVVEALAAIHRFLTDELSEELPDGHVTGYSGLLQHAVDVWPADGPAAPIAVFTARQMGEFPFFTDKLDHELIRRVQERILEVLADERTRFPRTVANVWTDLADLELLDENYREAERLLRRARDVYRDAFERITQEELDIEFWLVGCLAATGRHAEIEEELVATWQRCTERYGFGHYTSASALDNLIELYDRWDRPESAAPYIESHLAGRVAGDRNLNRLIGLSWFVLRTKGLEARYYELALEACQRAVELAPKDELALSGLGVAHYRFGRLEDARNVLESCETLVDEVDPTVCTFLAMTRKRLGDDEGARRLLNAVQKEVSVGGIRETVFSRMIDEARDVVMNDV